MLKSVALVGTSLRYWENCKTLKMRRAPTPGSDPVWTAPLGLFLKSLIGYDVKKTTELLVCSVEGCSSGTKAAGLCATHYERKRRGRNPDGSKQETPKPSLVCSVEICDRVAHGRGLCSAHLRRLRDHGDIMADKPIRGSGIAVKCSVESCDRDADSRGWCRAHWERWRRHGDVIADIPFNAVLTNKHPPNCSICYESEWAIENYVDAARIADGLGISLKKLRDHLRAYYPEALNWVLKERAEL